MRARSGGARQNADDEVFLSYNKEDRSFAFSVHAGLEALGIKIWSDANLPAGSRWQDVLQAAVERCKVMVVCVGPKGLGDFQKNEIEMAIELDSIEVIPVVSPDFKKVFPLILRNLQRVNWGSTDVDPVEQLASSIRRLLGQRRRRAQMIR